MTPVADERPYILKILREIDAAHAAGEHQRERWNRVWHDDRSAAIPYYMRSNGVVRINRKLYEGAHGYEAGWLASLRDTWFAKHFATVEGVAEFGCGTGQNLMPLKGRVSLLGLDWAESAVARVRSQGVHAALFDMFHPEGEFNLKNWGVLTVHAMEQLGLGWAPFLDYLLKARPAIVLHIEPALELYHPSELLDELAIRYHKKRAYLEGYLPKLQALDAEGRIRLLEVERTYVGSLCHEAYTVIAWRPQQ